MNATIPIWEAVLNGVFLAISLFLALMEQKEKE